MTKAKMIEMLNKMFDSYLTMEEACLDTIIKVDGKQFTLRDKLDEITDEKIALLTAIDALEQDNKWISVKDRRPEPNTWIMVYIKYPSPVFEFETGIQKMSGIKKVFYYGEGFYCDFGTITHWMPLPEPPKEGR